MAVDLHYKRLNAEKAGVIFTPNVEENYVCDEGCACNRGEDYCDTETILQKFTRGYNVECPDGSKGYAIVDGLFQCKGINQEIKAFFFTNVKGAKITF